MNFQTLLQNVRHNEIFWWSNQCPKIELNSSKTTETIKWELIASRSLICKPTISVWLGLQVSSVWDRENTISFHIITYFSSFSLTYIFLCPMIYADKHPSYVITQGHDKPLNLMICDFEWLVHRFYLAILAPSKKIDFSIQHQVSHDRILKEDGKRTKSFIYSKSCCFWIRWK